MSALLKIQELTAFYGDFQALFGVDFEIAAGEVVALIGANGAGKSTLLKSITGLLKAPKDSVRFAGEAISGLAPGKIVTKGIAMVPEGRRLFPSLSVEENLMIGGYSRRPGPWNLEAVYRLFPVLRERRRHPGTELSGGQQQMVAIGRALMSNPSLLICDEISLGLAPIIVKEIYDALPVITEGGLSVIVVEQDVATARSVSHRLYCMQEGADFPDRQIAGRDPRSNFAGLLWPLTGELFIMWSWIHTLLQGLMLGGLYAMFAAGQSLMFGVMRLTNTAHGDFTILAAFAAFSLLAATGPHGAAASIAVVLALLPLAFVFGYGLQRLVLNGTLGKDPLPSLVVTFGISIVIQNVLTEVFTSDPRAIDIGALGTQSLSLGENLSVGVLPLADLPDRGACHRRLAMAVWKHGAWARIPSHFG
ncbi:ATP-binding cassette domain-containing protein [Pseudoduganella sp. UC29_106]|uniref:ATP-binding cassette domain-containing protein n=1 Tax=Pseudoduganella sp. UC29_106 TaxID=3374553 RepID=UPI0037584D92